MRLEKSTLGILVNFLLGVAWAFVLIGALYTFFSYYKLSLIDAVIMTFLGALPGLFLVALLEYLIVGIERLEEMKKQTKLLEKLLQQKESSAKPDTIEKP
jgi:uncharacterized membrane protein (DUF106 family)